MKRKTKLIKRPPPDVSFALLYKYGGSLINNKTMRTFAEKFIGEKQYTDIADKEEHFYTDGNMNEIYQSRRVEFETGVPSMNIKWLKQYIEELEKEGANRIHIVPHIDHRGYYFYGVKLVEI